MRSRQRGVGRGRRTVVALVAMTIIGATANPVAANDEQAEFDAIRSRRSWAAWADGRPFSPFVGIPLEFTAGMPYVRSYMDSTPGRSEAFAGLYTLDQDLEEVMELSGYKNNTLARSNYPDIGRGTEAEWAPAGPGGPRSAVRTPTHFEALSEARTGPGDGAVTVALVGWSRATATYDRKDVIVTEASGSVSGVILEGGSIGLVESMVKVEHRLGNEPVVTYRLTLAGVQAGGQQLIGYGGEGVTLAGTKVGGTELAEQFNAQVAEHGDALEQAVAKLSLRVFQPAVEKDQSGAYFVTSPVVSIRSDNTFRKDQSGDNMGLRLGYMRTYTYLTALGDEDPSAATED